LGGFVLMSGFVTVYNYLGFRLLGAPFDLPKAVVGLLFVMYFSGTISAAVAGSLADRVGRRPVVLCGIAVVAVGLLLTTIDALAAVAAGLLVFTAGFFAAHAVVSSWVGRRATTNRALASGGYLFFYYLGSSVGGTAGGAAYEHGGWAATAAYVLVLAAVGAALVATVKPQRPLRS
jgi:predicted MFS family arabinose efflux permease